MVAGAAERPRAHHHDGAAEPLGPGEERPGGAVTGAGGGGDDDAVAGDVDAPRLHRPGRATGGEPVECGDDAVELGGGVVDDAGGAAVGTDGGGVGGVGHECDRLAVLDDDPAAVPTDDQVELGDLGAQAPVGGTIAGVAVGAGGGGAGGGQGGDREGGGGETGDEPARAVGGHGWVLSGGGGGVSGRRGR